MKTKIMLVLILFIAYSYLTILSAQEQVWMTNDQMSKIFQNEASDLDGATGYWTMMYGEMPLVAVTDSTANRMRLFSPVIEAEKLEKGQMKIMLEANFHSALDAKYSLYNDFVISVFTHPLRELTEAQLIDAMRQVIILSYTFGTTYTSTEMVFGEGFQDGAAPKINKSPQQKDKKN